MTNILERVAKLSRNGYNHFRPSTTDEYFALQLAIRLDDRAAAQHYGDLASRYSRGQLLTAYRQASASHLDLSRRFHQALDVSKRNGGNGADRSLAAVRIERRAVSIAIFSGDHLKYADSRQFASSPTKAIGTVVAFLTKFSEKFRFRSAALETPTEDGQHRASIHEAAHRLLQGLGIGVAMVDPARLLSSYGHPPLDSRSELRQVIGSIYPVLDQALGAPWTYDAAALGLHVQTERCFNEH